MTCLNKPFPIFNMWTWYQIKKSIKRKKNQCPIFPLICFEGGEVDCNWANTRMEKTYQLEPRTHFPHARAKQIIADELERTLEDVTYEPQKCLRLATELSETLRNRIKNLDTPQYKLVVRRSGDQEARHTTWSRMVLSRSLQMSNNRINVTIYKLPLEN